MAQLGTRSPLVLAKLGHDLRPMLDDTLRAPLPEQLQRLSDELTGYAAWREVGPPPEPENVGGVKTRDLWRDIERSDAPFSFNP